MRRVLLADCSSLTCNESLTHTAATIAAQLNEPLPPPDADLSPVAPDAEREIPTGKVRGLCQQAQS